MMHATQDEKRSSKTQKALLLALLLLLCLIGFLFYKQNQLQASMGSKYDSIANGAITTGKLSPEIQSQLSAAVQLAGAFPVTSNDVPNSCGNGEVLSFSNGKIICVTLSTTASGQVSVTTVGVPGPKGDTGSTGVAGSNGSNGNNGVDGVAGTSGTNGTNGAAGSTGSTGATGPQGPAGTPGVAGANGVNGTNGTNGTNGAAGSPGVLSTSLADGLSGSVSSGVLSLSLVTDPTGGLTVKSGGLTLLRSCSSGQVLAWDGSEWDCSANGSGAVSTGNLTSVTPGITITGGTGAVIGSGATIAIATATGSQTGLLNSVDWSTFNNKEDALTFSGNGLFTRSGNTISGTTCSSNQYVVYNGSTWSCTAVVTPTVYTAGAGLGLSGTTMSFDPSTLSTVSSVNGSDQLVIYNGTTSKRITYSDLFSGLLGSLNYQGTWDAGANSPNLTSTCTSGTKGYYYVVSTAGTTTLNGVSSWSVNDWAVCNGTSGWQRVQATNLVNSVFGRQGTVVAATGDYNASQITNTPAGSISGTNVQSALNGLDTAKLGAGLNSGLVFVGNSSNAATGVALSGDATINNTGVVTIASGAITAAKVASGTLTFANMASNSCTNGQVIKYNGTAWTCGTDNTGSAGTTYTAANSGGNANSPLSVSGSTIGFSNGTATGQYWAWNGTAWALTPAPSAGGSAGAPTSCSATANYACNGGNTLGAALTLGTTDSNGLAFATNNTNRFVLDAASSKLTGQGTTTVTSTGALALTSDTTSAVTLDSGTTGAINIGTGTSAKTITFGNSTGATALVQASGTGGTANSSTVTSGNAFALTANSLSSGNGLLVSSSSATGMTGSLASISFSGNDSSNRGTLLALTATGTSNATAGLKINVLGTGIALDVTGTVAIRRGTTYTSTGTQNNVTFGTGSNFNLNPASQLTITGITAGADGQLLTLTNVSTSTVTLVNQSTGSSAPNRIATSNSDIILPPNGSVILTYEATNGLWHATNVSTPIYGSVVMTSNSGQRPANTWSTVLSMTLPAPGTYQVCYQGVFNTNGQVTYRLYNSTASTVVQGTGISYANSSAIPVYICGVTTTTSASNTIVFQANPFNNNGAGFLMDPNAPANMFDGSAPVAPMISYLQLH